MITEHLWPEVDKAPTARAWPGYWRMSGVGGCQSALLAESQGLVTDRSSIAAEDGTIHELDILRRLHAAGYEIDQCRCHYSDGTPVKDPISAGAQVTLTLGNLPLVGHPDGRIRVDPEMPKYRLELKSKGFTFQRFKQFPTVEEAFPGEMAQVQCYMAADIDGILPATLYISKATFGVRPHEEIIRFDQEWLDRFLEEHFMPVVEAQAKGDPPEALSCHENPYIRRWCPLRSTCDLGMKEDLRPGAVAIENEPELLNVIAQWRKNKEVADEADKNIEIARVKLQRYLTQTQQTKVIIDGVPIQQIIQNRTKTNTARIKQLVPEEMWPEIWTPFTVEQMRVG